MKNNHLLKIGDTARALGVCTKTIRNWVRNGFIKCVIGGGGHRRFQKSEVERLLNVKESRKMKKSCILYCRVSTTIQRENLTRQEERLVSFAISNGYTIFQILKDIGSGMNFKRRGLLKMLKVCQTEKIDFIIVEYKDRLARFGVDLIKEILSYFGTELIIVNNTNSGYQQEIIEDMIAIIVHFSSRLYGKRRGRKKSKKMVDQIVNQKDIKIAFSPPLS